MTELFLTFLEDNTGIDRDVFREMELSEVEELAKMTVGELRDWGRNIISLYPWVRKEYKGTSNSWKAPNHLHQRWTTPSVLSQDDEDGDDAPVEELNTSDITLLKSFGISA